MGPSITGVRGASVRERDDIAIAVADDRQGGGRRGGEHVQPFDVRGAPAVRAARPSGRRKECEEREQGGAHHLDAPAELPAVEHP
jgi:hypothetical protein